MRGPETERSHKKRMQNGFYEKYMYGDGLDIGYRGSIEWAEPVLDDAIGIDRDYPKYDGIHLPFDDNSMDYVFSSHCLEHITDYSRTIEEWFRVLKLNGRLIIIVPHQHIYEKKINLPSQWNSDHKRFYTPASLLKEIEESLTPNSYRVRHLMDNDEGNDNSIPPNKHSNGPYEIECVIQKITPPKWSFL